MSFLVMWLYPRFSQFSSHGSLWDPTSASPRVPVAQGYSQHLAHCVAIPSSTSLGPSLGPCCYVLFIFLSPTLSPVCEFCLHSCCPGSPTPLQGVLRLTYHSFYNGEQQVPKSWGRILIIFICVRSTVFID